MNYQDDLRYEIFSTYDFWMAHSFLRTLKDIRMLPEAEGVNN